MANALYMEDTYLKEFEAMVTKADSKFIGLDRTAFYPNSGGQPNDTGTLTRVSDGKEFKVVSVVKMSGDISHEISEPGLEVGDRVAGRIDWDRRYVLMRNHTAAHVLSGVISKETGADITGNQLGLDKSRIDFSLENFDREQLKSYEEKANAIVNAAMPVNIRILPREEAFKIPALVKLRMGLPESIKEIRIIDIVGFDQQACAGCHVKNTSEIGKITIANSENKGKDNRRIYFTIG
jgi:misacylated tRNA(Ala) deacylase